jgi:hypothetical protein
LTDDVEVGLGFEIRRDRLPNSGVVINEEDS